MSDSTLLEGIVKYSSMVSRRELWSASSRLSKLLIAEAMLEALEEVGEAIEANEEQNSIH